MWHRHGNVVLLTLLNGMSAHDYTPRCRLTNVDDVTLDHAMLRAIRTIEESVFGGTVGELAITMSHSVSSARWAAAGRVDRYALHWFSPLRAHEFTEVDTARVLCWLCIC